VPPPAETVRAPPIGRWVNSSFGACGTQVAQQAPRDESGAGPASGLEALVESLGDVEGPAAKLAPGDKVIVVDGDLKGLMGRVEKVTDDGKVRRGAMSYSVCQIGPRVSYSSCVEKVTDDGKVRRRGGA
jgi:hypothetical protein